MNEEFRDARLAAIYDALQGERRDLDLYVALAERFRATSVLDVGCGTGVLALRLAGLGLRVVAVDPAAASLDVARAKPGAERVTWVHGQVGDVGERGFDLVTLTGNTAQQFTGDQEWTDLLRHVRLRLAPAGRLVFETRDPAARAWEGWTRASTETTDRIGGAGPVRSWTDVTRVDLPLVAFRSHWTFGADGATLTSDSTLRFRSEQEVRADLGAAGFRVEDVLEAPDRPGLELVFVAGAQPERGSP